MGFWKFRPCNPKIHQNLSNKFKKIQNPAKKYQKISKSRPQISESARFPIQAPDLGLSSEIWWDFRKFWMEHGVRRFDGCSRKIRLHGCVCTRLRSQSWSSTAKFHVGIVFQNIGAADATKTLTLYRPILATSQFWKICSGATPALANFGNFW